MKLILVACGDLCHLGVIKTGETDTRDTRQRPRTNRMGLDEDAPSRATLEKEREIRIRERRERIMQKIESQKVGGEAQNAIAERERRKMVSLVRGLGAAACSGTRLRLSA